ncbi:MAG: tRNA (adenosine(37)-N6)-threonylcarbamoyltransferase complex dimerization subunit type 1 TsaB [Hyphomicrobium sp.]
MNILAFDTCFDACSAAAGRGVRSLTPSISFVSEPMATGHAEHLMPMIESVMQDVGLAFTALDRIAVANGPGTFTGARIAIAAARALALASGAPIVAYTSLNLMAMSPAIPAARSRRVGVATDARRGEVYLQIFDRHSLAPEGPPCVLAVNDAAAALLGDSVTLAGTGARALASVAQSAGLDVDAILPDLLPDAIDMLFAAGEAPTSRNVLPLYLRPPDAKPPTVRSISRFGA